MNVNLVVLSGSLQKANSHESALLMSSALCLYISVHIILMLRQCIFCLC